MRVTVTRSGGFAGLTRRGTADTAGDPSLRALLDSIDFDALPAPRQVPDQFLYTIEVEGRREVQVGETHLTGQLRRLVDAVLSRGGPG